MEIEAPVRWHFEDRRGQKFPVSGHHDHIRAQLRQLFPDAGGAQGVRLEHRNGKTLGRLLDGRRLGTTPAATLAVGLRDGCDDLDAGKVSEAFKSGYNGLGSTHEYYAHSCMPVLAGVIFI